MEDRKIAQEKKNLKHILEESLNEIYMFDADTYKFVYVNKGALSNMGYTMEEMAEMTPVDIKPQFNHQSFKEFVEPLRTNEKRKLFFETYHQRADGSLYPVEVHLQLVQESNVFIAIKLDLSERKKVEEEREHLAHVLEESLNEIYLFDAESLKFTYVNKGALANLGYTMSEMADMTPLDIKPEFNRQEFDEVIQPLRDSTKNNLIFDTKHQRKDGSTYDVEVHLQLIQDISKPVFMAIILDVTERKKVEKEILQLNENLEKKVEERTASLLSYQNQLRSLAFQLTKAKEMERKRLATFLHDNLGQVLAIGKMELDQIKNKSLPEDITANVERLSDLINDAIKYTREFMADLMPSPSGNEGGLLDSIKWVAKKMEKYGLEVSVIEDEEPKPLSEEIQSLITQSVRELLFNVVKHADVKSAEVILKRVDHHVQVTVKDEGKGFDSENKNLAESKTAGFGLFNLQEQMEWLQGDFELSSTPGGGTEITLVYPLEHKEREGVEKLISSGESLQSKNDSDKSIITVLIADDHQMMRKGLRKMIEEQEDMEVIVEASNGKEAVDLARKHSPDVVIMDINMPVMDGIEATRQITQERISTRVIGLSFHEKKDVAQAIIDAGASIYLSKSEVFETLCATVRSEGAALKKSSEK